LKRKVARIRVHNNLPTLNLILTLTRTLTLQRNSTQ